jgi:hypothetical protein
MDIGLLKLLHEIDLLDEVPDEEPEARHVLSRRCCPLHDGADNPHAFLVFKDGYACTTHNCHRDKRFGCNLFGLVRHLVFRATGKDMNFKDAVVYARRSRDELRRLVPEGERYVGRQPVRRTAGRYTPDELASCLRVPDGFYLGRGFLPETLESFGVGTCTRDLPDGKRLVREPGFEIQDSRPAIVAPLTPS